MREDSIDLRRSSNGAVVDASTQRLSKSRLLRPSTSSDVIHVEHSVVDELSLGSSPDSDEQSLSVSACSSADVSSAAERVRN